MLKNFGESWNTCSAGFSRLVNDNVTKNKSNVTKRTFC